MLSKILLRILIVLVSLFALFELVCWIFAPFPVEPLHSLDLHNDIPGFKKDVRVIFDRGQVRFLDWTAGDKPPGTVRILCVGGWATLGMLQNAEDTWWGRLHSMLKQQGLKVESAARGFERTGLIEIVSLIGPAVNRLKPDVIIVNSGFDDVIIHSTVYSYDKDKLAKMPDPPRQSAVKEFLVKYSQAARFKRWWTTDGETAKMQNELGRKDVYKRFFEEKRKQVHGLPRNAGISRADPNDPLYEYLDALAAMKDLAAKHGAALIITGEACLHDSVMGLTEEECLLAYISLSAPEANGNVAAARPDPGWVQNEMRRFSTAAEKFASDNQIPWIDLNVRVERSTDNFFSDVLLTDAGADAAAKLLLPVVQPVVKAKAGK